MRRSGPPLRGSVHQVLVYDGSACVGWCQYGSPAELPTIKNAAKYERARSSCPTGASAASSPAVGTAAQGVARAAVSGALEGSGPQAAASWRPTRSRPRTGSPSAAPTCTPDPEELFAELGFVRDRQIAKWRWVMRARV